MYYGCSRGSKGGTQGNVFLMTIDKIELCKLPNLTDEFFLFWGWGVEGNGLLKVSRCQVKATKLMERLS